MDEAGRVVDDDEEDAPAPMALSEQVQGNLGRMVGTGTLSSVG
jgi:hypothetical protein